MHTSKPNPQQQKKKKERKIWHLIKQVFSETKSEEEDKKIEIGIPLIK
jgi:hypothetical protein